MSMLLELYGVPAPIRTSYPTRQHPDCIHPRTQVMCPRCHSWQDLVHNSHCHRCCIDLTSVEVEQPTPAIVATEPAAVEVAETQVVASIETSETATQAGPTLLLDNEEQRAYFSQFNARAAECVKQREEWEASREHATQAEPGPDEQDTLIAELAFEADAEVDRERHVAIRSGKYVLWHRRDSMMAVDCSCGDRVHRGRRAGRCCKHMRSHNDTLKPATRQQEAA